MITTTYKGMEQKQVTIKKIHDILILTHHFKTWLLRMSKLNELSFHTIGVYFNILCHKVNISDYEGIDS